MKHEKTSITISIVALIASMVNAFYTQQESGNAKRKLVVLEKQLEFNERNLKLYEQELAILSDRQQTSKQSLNVIEKELTISQNRAELEKERLDFERARQLSLAQYRAVINSTTSTALSSPLTHLKEIQLSIHNNSQITQGYSVRIESKGFGVYWGGKSAVNAFHSSCLLYTSDAADE